MNMLIRRGEQARFTVEKVDLAQQKAHAAPIAASLAPSLTTG